ncbi:MAG TPA: hypothetical protein VFS62_18040, partial [Chloroflexota bacterium]|nr:hypothetical protein [Chloroflexota bacterium]
MAEPYVGAEFPKTEEVEGLWVWDKFHAPRPIAPLSDDLVWITLGEGFTKGQDRFACPLGMNTGSINYYTYASFVLMPEMTTDQVGERMKRYQHNLEQLVPRVGQLWESEWLPGIKPEIIRARDLNYDSLNDQQLIAELDHQREAMVERWSIHGSINFILIAASSFRDWYREELKPEDENEGYAALAGFQTRSMEGGSALWKLSRTVKNNPSLTKLFEDSDPKDLPAKLEQSPDGKAFLKDFNAYLDEFGWRG